jgi:hypothetical protein
MDKKDEKLTRQAVIAWMKTVLATNEWSAEEWARRSNASATSITRLLKEPDTANLPSTDTLAKLARAAGSQPVFAGEAFGRIGNRVPLIDLPTLLRFLKSDVRVQIAMISKLKDEGPTTLVPYKTSVRALSMVVTADTFSGRGIYPGDTITVEPPDVIPCTPGSLVAAVVDNKLGVYLYQPPHLIPHPAGGPIEAVLIKDAKVWGRVIHQHRDYSE